MSSSSSPSAHTSTPDRKYVRPLTPTPVVPPDAKPRSSRPSVLDSTPGVDYYADDYPLVSTHDCSLLALAPAERTKQAIRKSRNTLHRVFHSLSSQIIEPDWVDDTYTATLFRDNDSFRRAFSSTSASSYWSDLVLRGPSLGTFPDTKKRFVSCLTRWCAANNCTPPPDLTLEWEQFSNSAWCARNRIFVKAIHKVYVGLSTL